MYARPASSEPCGSEPATRHGGLLQPDRTWPGLSDAHPHGHATRYLPDTRGLAMSGPLNSIRSTALRATTAGAITGRGGRTVGQPQPRRPPAVTPHLMDRPSWPCRPGRAVPCRAVPCRAVPCRQVMLPSDGYDDIRPQEQFGSSDDAGPQLEPEPTGAALGGICAPAGPARRTAAVGAHLHTRLVSRRVA